MGFYHCVSRVVDRNFVFGSRERDVFRKILRQVEAFSGLRVVTWTILSNHFHVLVEVTAPEELEDEAILKRCRGLYSPGGMVAIEVGYQDARRAGDQALQAWRGRFLRRMWDLSEFMKTLKQKFTSWFNRKHDRVGALWESRFRSVLVEGSWNCLQKVAAYIDLNAVRAGLVEDPKDFPWCGYAEAAAGDRQARRGLVSAMQQGQGSDQDQVRIDWRHVSRAYRKLIFGIGEATSSRTGICRARVVEVWQRGGKLSIAELLRCRIRYFTDGVVIGSEAFVESFFQSRRGMFSVRRKSGARRMVGGDWHGLRSARALRSRAVSPPG